MKEEYYIDTESIRCYFPYETDKKVSDYGVLLKYIGKTFSRDDIDQIISEMIIRHPYVNHAKRLHLTVMKNNSYYHIMDFYNYHYKKQEKDDMGIKYEKEGKVH